MGAFDGLTLHQIREPLYDRFWIERGDAGSDRGFHKILFQDQIGKHDCHGRMKTIEDTNLLCGAMLAMPLHAKWSWVRLVIEDWCHPDDVRRFLKDTSIEVRVGQDWIWSRKSLTAFEPIITVDAGLKKGERIEIDLEAFRKFIHGGEIHFWPWLEDVFEEIEIGPSETFSVKLEGKVDFLRGPIVGKILLGPWLYRPPRKPKFMEPKPGGGSLDDVDLGEPPEEPFSEA